MLHYPVESDVLLFLRHIVTSLQPFANAHSVALTFECDKETLRLSYHPETVASDVTQLLCRVVTFTPQNQRVKLRVTLINEQDAFYLKLVVSVNFPFVVTYTIENRKIVSHWLVADQMVLMEQLGIEPAVAAH
jgi:hypothetical protein